ncbi:GrxA family glutaredoxin [Erwinia phage AH04]|uniref:GrxA family glutaredoxin n=1 Tax=Erwinia phage AH04 TaxID=2869569 RepID=A0AAE7X1K6_9CAUD|nr:thioredoxin domain [Erwinia phage AH04]QZA70506.1 GrxA family glutaredoxin [Erwinia phage AH04]
MKVVIYGKDQCVFCKRAKQLVEERDVDNEYIDIIETGLGKEGLEKIVGGPVTSVPQIFVDDVHVGGYTDLVSYLNKPNKPEVEE